MSAKIIQFPKSPPQSDERHHFKTFFPLYLIAVSVWSALIFTFHYEVGVGIGIWLIGLLLLANLTYIFGVKGNQRSEKDQQSRENRNWIQSIYWPIVRVGTYLIFVITVAFGTVATIVFTGLLYSRKQLY